MPNNNGNDIDDADDADLNSAKAIFDILKLMQEQIQALQEQINIIAYATGLKPREKEKEEDQSQGLLDLHNSAKGN